MDCSAEPRHTPHPPAQIPREGRPPNPEHTEICRTTSSMSGRLGWLCLLALLDQPERLGHHQGVVLDREFRVTQGFAHFLRLPELLVPSPPFSDRGVPSPTA